MILKQELVQFSKTLTIIRLMAKGLTDVEVEIVRYQYILVTNDNWLDPIGANPIC